MITLSEYDEENDMFLDEIVLISCSQAVHFEVKMKGNVQYSIPGGSMGSTQHSLYAAVLSRESCGNTPSERKAVAILQL